MFWPGMPWEGEATEMLQGNIDLMRYLRHRYDRVVPDVVLSSISVRLFSTICFCETTLRKQISISLALSSSMIDERVLSLVQDC